MNGEQASFSANPRFLSENCQDHDFAVTPLSEYLRVPALTCDWRVESEKCFERFHENLPNGTFPHVVPEEEKAKNFTRLFNMQK